MSDVISSYVITYAPISISRQLDAVTTWDSAISGRNPYSVR